MRSNSYCDWSRLTSMALQRWRSRGRKQRWAGGPRKKWKLGRVKMIVCNEGTMISTAAKSWYKHGLILVDSASILTHTRQFFVTSFCWMDSEGNPSWLPELFFFGFAPGLFPCLRRHFVFILTPLAMHSFGIHGFFRGLVCFQTLGHHLHLGFIVMKHMKHS